MYDLCLFIAVYRQFIDIYVEFMQELCPDKDPAQPIYLGFIEGLCRNKMGYLFIV